MACVAVCGAMAQTEAEARVLAEDGNLEGAVSMLRTVITEEPKNNEAALLLAGLLWNSGHDDEAVELYEALSRKGLREATLERARIAFSEYDIEKSRALLADYRKSLRKGKSR